MHKIEHPESYKINKFDGVCASAVYTGGLTFLKPANDKLKWREDKDAEEMCYKPFYVLTLSEIADQMTNAYGGECPMLTVFTESPLQGKILQYGNYGDEWWQIGETGGYA